MNRRALFILLFLLIPPALSQSKTFSSGEKQVVLLELFSSEGCSSCPPADRKIAELIKNKSLFKDFVALNFHVDYWNQLGWVDRFSNKKFTNRQRRYASEWKSSRVYTPAFVLNGNEYRNRRLSSLASSQTVGELTATSDSQGYFQVEFRPYAKQSKQYWIHMALLGHGLKTQVKYGENAGETLFHEFVVLKTASQKLNPKRSSHQTRIKSLTESQSRAKKHSLVFWVTEKGSQKPVQATGGYITQN